MLHLKFVYLKYIVYIIIHQMLYFYIYLIFLRYIVEVHYDVLFSEALNWEIEWDIVVGILVVSLLVKGYLSLYPFVSLRLDSEFLKAVIVIEII